MRVWMMLVDMKDVNVGKGEGFCKNESCMIG